MKKISVIMTLLLSASMLMAQGRITQEEYLSLVEKNNKNLQIAYKNTEASKVSIRKAFASFMPTIGVSSSYTRNFTDIEQDTVIGAMYVPEANLKSLNGSYYYPGYKTSMDTNYDNEILMAVGMNLNIYDPQSFSAVSMSRKGYQASKKVEELTKEQLLYNGKVLYAQVLLLDAVARSQKEVSKTFEEVYKSQEQKFNAGTIKELDLRMAEVDWKNSLSDLAQAEKNLKLGKLALKTLAAIPLHEEISVVDLEDKDNWSIKTEEYLKNNNKEYLLSVLNKDIASLQYKNALASYLPAVSTSFNLCYGQMGGMDDFDSGYGKVSHDTWNDYNYTASSLTFKVTLPITSGGYRSSVIKEARINMEKKALEVQNKEDEIRQKYADAVLRLEEARYRMDSSKALEEAALRASHLARTSLVNGLATQLQVSQAETSLTQAHLSMQSSIFEYRSALYALDFIEGK